nr:hypothetical protein [Paenibacillus bovis]
MKINEGAFLIPTFEVPSGLKVYINNKFNCRTLSTSVAVTPIAIVKPGDVIKLTKSKLFSGEEIVFEKKLSEMDINYKWIPQLEYRKEKVKVVPINEEIYGQFIEEADYIGDLQDGKPNGYGRAYYKNSDILAYEGEWKDGKFHGTGRIVHQYAENGNCKYQFENGKQVKELTGIM